VDSSIAVREGAKNLAGEMPSARFRSVGGVEFGKITWASQDNSLQPNRRFEFHKLNRTRNETLSRSRNVGRLQRSFARENPRLR
jgi:hypothetical protein